MESPCEFGTEPPGSISHEVSCLVKRIGKRRPGRPRRMWEDTIGIYHKVTDVNRVDLAQDRDH